MDALGLTVLLREIEADCVVIQDAADKAQVRLQARADGHLEACAYQLARLYNVLEKILERICHDFENHFDKQGDYHERLIQRLALTLPGIRPSFIPQAGVRSVRELKGFRHVVRHAYDLEFREDRIKELAGLAAQLACQLPVWCADFGERTRTEQGWT
jgi:hypothetical protein